MHKISCTRRNVPGTRRLPARFCPPGLGGGSNREGNRRKDDLLNHCVDTTAAAAPTPSAMATPNLCIIQVEHEPGRSRKRKVETSSRLRLGVAGQFP